ncbi:Holliday junction branch migration protein RuvA [Paenibacillus sp. N1-5-1-14]|uniref:Holliday junction branch migration protein RuvA n=1 Tax=Paenibacillus radicibacter TaxID=2972488 RepID=UPI002158FBBB|nr:Holliday junction branch migration protein RuvA [Paenibacillus radicibacter]MCR8644118.1 Holliday junction branch migration protein RuvA [Paenibacillus radicibacter]
MIDFLRGRLAVKEIDYVVLDVNGVGYRVWCPNPHEPKFRDGEELTLFCHYHVREDAHLLFGFPTREEQYLFRRLIEVSGIGPKVALGMLGGARPETIISAIRGDNLTFLCKLPGIGKKTAQRLVLDLKDKLGAALERGGALGDATWANGIDVGLGLDLSPASSSSSDTSEWQAAKEALQALGYNEAESDRALQATRAKVSEKDASVDVIVRHALKVLYAQ